jgi:hypothetical protein
MSDLTSRPFRPSPEKCCEACVFGKGEHADWCLKRPDARYQHTATLLKLACESCGKVLPIHITTVHVADRAYSAGYCEQCCPSCANERRGLKA